MPQNLHAPARTPHRQHFRNQYLVSQQVHPVADFRARGSDVFATPIHLITCDHCRWADIFVIAPVSANSLAKLANGMADNLLTCVARAWDHDSAPMMVRGGLCVRYLSVYMRTLQCLLCVHLREGHSLKTCHTFFRGGVHLVLKHRAKCTVPCS